MERPSSECRFPPQMELWVPLSHPGLDLPMEEGPSQLSLSPSSKCLGSSICPPGPLHSGWVCPRPEMERRALRVLS